MSRDEQALNFPLHDQLPLAGDLLEVAPGVRWLRMPLPFVLDHINLWLLRDRFDGREGWTLVDCGVATDVVRSLWETVLADRLDNLPIVRVLATHMHPDHLGMADWLTRRFDAPLWMTQGEYLMGRTLSAASADDGLRSVSDHFLAHGADDGWIARMKPRLGRQRYRQLVPAIPPAYTRIFDRQPVTIGGRRWQVIAGHGHSPEHAALWCEQDRLLISGDMVLPRISTNVSVFEIEPMADPVRWFLDSLERFAGCAADTLVLPSHGRPFRGLHTRIAQLQAHHADRLAALDAALQSETMTAAESVAVVFPGRQFDDDQRFFAIGESLAHLHALWYDGRVRRSVGRDNRIRFGAAGPG